MRIGVLKEPPAETRVSLLPEHIAALKKWNVDVCIERGAGEQAFAADGKYTEAGATVCSRQEVLQSSDIVLSIQLPASAELSALSSKVLLGVYQPLFQAAQMKELAEKGLTIFSMDMLPRTTRAQSMDVLSSQANIAGYKAVLEAANLFPKYFPMFMTAAGSIPPAKMLILGAGVAGLQAIATARRLGAMVEAFDTRQAAKEEVESLGAKFIEVEGAVDDRGAGGYAVQQSEEYLQRQRAEVQARAAKADIIITTAQVRGRRAPMLLPAETVDKMRPGSVVVDLAASTGGNCELTKDGQIIRHNGVTIIGDSNLANRMPQDASTLFGNNVTNFLTLLLKKGVQDPDFSNEIVRDSCISLKKTEAPAA